MAHPLSRTDVRLGLVALAVVGCIGAGAFTLGGSETGRALGRTLSIAVVAPVEPEVDPGGTMEVGALSDGFDRAALDRVAEAPMDDTLPPPAWIGDESLGDRMPMPTPVSATLVADAGLAQGGTTGDPLADGSRAFGFDAPRPDYAAERALRWSRMEPAAAESETAAPANADSGPVEYSSE